MQGIPRRDFLRFGLTAMCGASRHAWGRQGRILFPFERPMRSPGPPVGWAQLPTILASIVPPQFPDRDFVITDYGATTAIGSDSNPALNAAIRACHRAGGGRVVVPAGHWTCHGPILLLGNVNLYLESNAIIEFGYNPSDYLPVRLVRWQGIRCYSHSPLIYAYRQNNIAITGSGTFNGNGFRWAQWAATENHDWALLQKMARTGVPVGQRIFGAGSRLRPTLFEAYDCQNILLQGVTFEGSPFWTMHPVFCTNVTIQEITVIRGELNDDGCDPDSCLDVLIEGCSFSTVDDNISIKAGYNPDAEGLPGCENIVIQNCNCLRSTWSGLTIGTDVAGGVRNVFIQNCTVNRCINAHYIKARANWGGLVENVYIRSNRVGSCHSLLALLPDSYDQAGPLGPPIYSNINMQGVTCLASKGPVFSFKGDPRLPIDEVNLNSIEVTRADTVASINHTAHLSASDITVDGSPVYL